MDAYRGGGPAEPGRAGGARGRPGRRAARPAPAGAPRAQRPRRLDLAAGAGRGHAPDRGGARRRVRGGELLRDVLHHAPAPDRRLRLRRRAVPPRGRRRGHRRAARPPRRAGLAAERRGVGAEPVPRALRLRAGRAGRRPRGAGGGCAAPWRSRSRGPSPPAAGWAARRRRAARRARTSRRSGPRRLSSGGSSLAWMPETLDAYAAHGGLAGLHAARRLGPAGILAALKASRLAGRGGAAFPAATKWEAVAQHPARPHYVVVNADESETGTFKDRILLEWDPYAVLEGAAIAAYTCGAEQVFIYIRGEYRHAHERLAQAIRGGERGATRFGEALGDDTRLAFELRRGAGAYICGEETALLNSIEGKRGEPRSKPPFPVHHGLFGRPTVINNVETLACVPGILADGADAFRALGTPDSPGTKLFSVSGHVAPPRRLRDPVRDDAPRAARPRGRRPRGPPAARGPVRRRGGDDAGRGGPRPPAHRRGAPPARRHGGLRRDRGPRRDRRHPRHDPARRRVLRPRVVRAVRAVPDRHAAPGRAPLAARDGRGRLGPARRGRPRDARRLHLRTRPDRGQHGPVRAPPPPTRHERRDHADDRRAGGQRPPRRRPSSAPASSSASTPRRSAGARP